MAFAGKSEKKEHVTAAIAANIWMSFEKNSRDAMDDESLEVIVLNCEVGVCVQLVGVVLYYIVCPNSGWSCVD